MRSRLFILCVASAPLPVPALPVDLMETYRQARTSDPELARMAAMVGVHNEARLTARAHLLPELDLEYQFTQKNPVVGSTPGFPSGSRWTRTRKIRLALQHSLVDPRKSARVRVASLSFQGRRAEYESATQSLAARVAAAYFRVLMDEDRLLFAAENERALARYLAYAKQHFLVGLATITDVRDVEAQHDASSASLIEAGNSLGDSRQAVAQITGEPVDDLHTLSERLPMTDCPPESPGEWVAKAVQANPRIKATQFKLQAAEYEIRAARAASFPTINVSASYSQNTTWRRSSTAQGALPHRRRGIGGITFAVTLRMPLYSGGSIQSAIRSAIGKRNAAADELESIRRQIIRNTLNHYRRVAASTGRLEATRSAVTSSRFASDAALAGLEAGTRTLVDVLLAHRKLMRSLNEHSRARHESVLEKLLLRQEAGIISVSDLIQVNRALR